MRNHYSVGAWRLPWAIFLVTAFPAMAGEMNAWSNDDTSARIELRSYRFQQHWGQGYERLVLEFHRQDRTSRQDPMVKVSQAGGDWMITVDPANLTGALPESLINESYQYKSKFMGPLSINLDGRNGGFALRLGTKRSEAVPNAFWLASPPRLVIDTYRNASAKNSGGERGTASREYDPGHVSIARQKSHFGPFDNYMCFPAAARVGLNVVFQAHATQAEELKNVQVNLGNSGELSPTNDSIVCYARESQVRAELSFEKRDWYADMNRAVDPAAAGAAAAPAAVAPGKPAAAPAPAAKGPAPASVGAAAPAAAAGKPGFPALPGMKPTGGSLLPSAATKPGGGLLPPAK